MEMACLILKEKGLLNIFWVEAMYTIVYILNRCSTKAVPNKTLVKAWSRQKPSAKYLSL